MIAVVMTEPPQRLVFSGAFSRSSRPPCSWAAVVAVNSG
jgi:hypothetical protein